MTTDDDDDENDDDSLHSFLLLTGVKSFMSEGCFVFQLVSSTIRGRILYVTVGGQLLALLLTSKMTARGISSDRVLF